MQGLVLERAGFVHANGQRALAGVSLALAPGERIAVIGPSGAGKTTLVRVLGAALRPGAGGLRWNGIDPWSLDAAGLRAWRARIGTVHQQPPIPGRLRVVGAVLAGRVGQWSTWRSLASLVVPHDAGGARDALARLDLADRVFDRCDRLSGGQLQRVGIARVLYQQPELTLADEPVSALDPTLAGRAVAALVEDSEQNGSMLVASLHAVDLALKWFPRIVGMRAGEVVFDRPTAAVDEALLRDLYAAEGGALPTQGGRPRDVEPGVDQRAAGEASAVPATFAR